MIYKINWEDLLPGPVGEYIEVIDFDAPNGWVYEPVDLDSKGLLAQHGLRPSEGNAKFHQQFIYAVVMQTIENFERALGRKIIWRPRLVKRYRNGKQYREEYVQRLRIYPHAMREANAYYTQEKIALLFGYFKAGSRVQGTNFPGGAVFTCLSPDIIAHETTHAILDSIHPRYLENTNPDVPAFHEAFADIVALLQRFSNPSLVEHQLEKTRGRLDEYSLLGELATQFGQAMETGRGALRSAIGQFDEKTEKWKKIEADPASYQSIFDAHGRGAILVATIFDAFMRLYNYKTQDLLRIATQGTGILPQGAIHPDLVKRLACEASEIALHLLSVCIRALDYCPPFDITFGSFLRAMITADVDISPEQNNEYRVALIEAFRAWGIFPDKVNTLSTYSLRWAEPDFTSKESNAMALVAEYLKTGIQKAMCLQEREEIAASYNMLQAKLRNLLRDPQKRAPELWKKYKLDEKTWRHFLEKIGVVFEPFTCDYENSKIEFVGYIPLEVHSVRPAFRIGPDDKQLEQVIITLTQTHRVKEGELKGVLFRGGSTIILSISDSRLKADYIILKNIKSRRRLKNQLDYQFRKTASFALTESIYESDEGFDNINFEKLHFH